ncbi:hypothetical protein ACSVIJ_04690 [Pseudomonas sp. NCHU5208]|uniref:hypothetical protein n=1 Tax=unclassified Pseudomonas TaxID=196821 RepID=UPI003F9B1DFF
MARLGEPIHHSGPIVEVSPADLARWGSLSGVGPSDWIRFQQEICWVREPTAEIFFRHGGRLLKDGPRFCDHPRFLSGLEAGVGDAIQLCKAYAVGPESSLEIILEAAIQDVPYLKARPPLGGITSGAYLHPIYSISDNWFYFDEGLMAAYSAAVGESERHEAWMAIPRIGPRAVVERQVVWNSKLDLAEGGTGRVEQFLLEQRGALSELLQTVAA